MGIINEMIEENRERFFNSLSDKKRQRLEIILGDLESEMHKYTKYVVLINPKKTLKYNTLKLSIMADLWDRPEIEAILNRIGNRHGMKINLVHQTGFIDDNIFLRYDSFEDLSHINTYYLIEELKKRNPTKIGRPKKGFKND